MPHPSPLLQAANQKLMLQVAEESKRLSDPLQRAQEELRALQSDLRDADKDRQSLRYAKTRLKVRRGDGQHAMCNDVRDPR